MTTILDTTDIANHPCLLRAGIVEESGCRFLIEYRSPIVKPNQPLYAPIREFLNQNQHTVTYDETIRDTSMMGYKTIVRAYLLHD